MVTFQSSETITFVFHSDAHLVGLRLWMIPQSGHTSPKPTVTGLSESVLTMLGLLLIELESHQCCPDRKSRRLPPQTRLSSHVLTIKEAHEHFRHLVDHFFFISSSWAITFFH